MSTAKHVKRKVRNLAEDAEDQIDEAYEELEDTADEAETLARRWAPVFAVASIAVLGIALFMRHRRMTRLQRGAHEAVDRAFRLSSDARESARESAREIAERSSRLLRKIPRVRVEMP